MTGSDTHDNQGTDDGPNEYIGHQQNEIDGAEAALETRLEHITGPWGSGLLDGEFIGQHQSARAEAYLEGYADALAYAIDEVGDIQNLVKHAINRAEHETDAAAVLSTLMRSLYGSNPQASIEELDIGTLVDQLAGPFDDDTVRRAIEEARYDDYLLTPDAGGDEGE